MSTIRAGIKRCFRKLGWSVQQVKYDNSEEEVVGSLLRLIRPAAVLDVGANIGQYGRLVRSAGFRGRIISFEAIPDVHAQLRQVASNDSAWTIAPCAALGSAKAEIEINISANTVSSSLLPMRREHLDVAPDSVYVRKQRVPVERLDAIAAALVPAEGSLLLKVDTQGYEKEVLLGATGLLGRVAALQVELSLIPLYEGAPSLAEMVSFVEQQGFEMFNFVSGYKDLKTGRVIQVDGFFVRKGTLA